MRSKTSCFNTAVWKKTLTGFWPLALAYVLIWVFLLPMQLTNSAQWDDGGLVTVWKTLSAGTESAVVMSAVFSVAMAMAVYGWLYGTGSTGFMCALPLRRETLFLSCMAGGLTLLLGGSAAVFLITAATQAAMDVLCLWALWQWLAMTALELLCFFGFASLCAVLTGKLPVLPAVYVLFQFAAVALEETLRYLLRFLTYGMPVTGRTLDWLSPVWYLAQHLTVEPVYGQVSPGHEDVVGYFFAQWGLLALYALSGLALAGLALLLFRRRRMENATEVVAIPVLKPVFRWCLALACALGLPACVFLYAVDGRGLLGLAGAALLLGMLLLGGFVGWFAADMLMRKTFRVFRLHPRGWALFSGLLCLLVLAAELDVTGYERRLPDPAEVAYVSLSGGGVKESRLRERQSIEDMIALQESIVTHKTVHESAQESACPDYTQLKLQYYGAEGELLQSRHYYLAADESQQRDGESDLRRLERLMNRQEAIESRKELTQPVTEDAITYAYISHTDAVDGNWQADVELTSAEAWELYTHCILPDIADGTLGRVWLVEDEDYAKTVLNVTFYMDISTRTPAGEYEYESFYTVPTTDSLRTTRWLREHGVELVTIWDCWQSYGYEGGSPYDRETISYK